MLVQTLLTLEDTLALPERDDCRYELDEGELIELPLPRPRHQIIVAKLQFSLQLYVVTNPIGIVMPSDTPFLLQRDPDVLRGPDIALVRSEAAEIITGATSLAVEVAPPSDRMTTLLKKIFQYLEVGSEEVWLVMPESREVQIYTQTDVRTVRGTDELTSGMLPGFTIPVASLFV